MTADGYILDLDGVDPEHAPRGGARHLEAAVRLAAGLDEGAPDDLDLSDRRAIEGALAQLAGAFNAEVALHDEGARLSSISAQLIRIEDACAELAAAFDEASHAAHDALGGRGIGGLPLRTLGSAIGDPGMPRRRVMAALAGRYHIPLGPVGSARTLADWTADPSAFNSERLPVNADWPVAVRALREVVRADREDFERYFRRSLARFNDIVDRGADGTLRPVERARRGRAPKAPAKPKTLLNDPSSIPDRGGKESISDLTRGPPKWILARECRSYMAETWADDEMKGPPDGRLYRLTLAVYAYATGEDVAEVETPGNAYDAGLGRHVTAAIRIGRALVARNMPKPDFAPLTDEEFQQRVSLERAWISGRVPPWLI